MAIKSVLLTAAAMLLVSASLPRDPDLPGKADIQAAFDRLWKCNGGKGPECPPPDRSYVVHRVSCVAIASEQGRPAAACRVDSTVTEQHYYGDGDGPKLRVSRTRDECLRFVRGGVDDPAWRFSQSRATGCEAPSVLKRDPANMPRLAELEDTLVEVFQCYGDGPETDCFNYSKSVSLDYAVCTGIVPDEEGKRRVACTVTGTVFYTSRRPERFKDLCVRFARYGDPGETPASWGQSFIEAEYEKPCESRYRGREIDR